MKTTLKVGLALLMVGASAFAVCAQDDNGGPPNGDNSNGPRGHRPPPSPLVMALDVNHDGVIDASEIANAPAELKTLDKNGDGQLTPDEYLPPRPPGAPDNDNHRPPPSPLVMALDVNHDGVIDSNEIANASAELKTLDKNGDGQLTPDEFCPPPPNRGDNSSDGQNSPDGGPSGPPPNQ